MGDDVAWYFLISLVNSAAALDRLGTERQYTLQGPKKDLRFVWVVAPFHSFMAAVFAQVSQRSGLYNMTELIKFLCKERARFQLKWDFCIETHCK